MPGQQAACLQLGRGLVQALVQEPEPEQEQGPEPVGVQALAEERLQVLVLPTAQPTQHHPTTAR